MENHMFKKLFTAAWLAVLFTFGQLAAAATNISVTATPSNPTAPATVTLAVSGDSDGNPIMVTRVEYFNGTTSLGVSVQSPFTLTLNNLAAGTYQISAKVTTTDPANPVLQSVPLAVTVGTAPGAVTAYFIHTDQLNTPRAITDGSGNLVWQWDSDPFGKEAANEQPAGQPAFTFNQRFPGQQFDRESNLHYNYLRDYDPALGRYAQSDPIGLNGGINGYLYGDADPLRKFDPTGEIPLILPAIAIIAESAGWALPAAAGTAIAAILITPGDSPRSDANDPMASSRQDRDRASRQAANIIAKSQGRNGPNRNDDKCDKQEKADEQQCLQLPWQGGVRARCMGSAATRAAMCRAGKDMPDLCKK
jgi:RHS repeat-associated protein